MGLHGSGYIHVVQAAWHNLHKARQVSADLQTSIQSKTESLSCLTFLSPQPCTLTDLRKLPQSHQRMCKEQTCREPHLRTVACINAELWLQVLHNHVDDQWPIQLYIVQALVLEVWPQSAAGLFSILKDLLLRVL